MQNIRSIYSRDPGIRLHGLRIRRVRLNRHLPEAKWIARHRHSFCQMLLFLGGSGRQLISGEALPVSRGHLFFIPPGVEHSFLELTGQRPLCLALDLDLELAGARPIIGRLTSGDLSRVRHALSGLTRWRNGDERVEPGEAGDMLRLIDILLRALNLLKNRSTIPEQSTILRAAKRALHEPASLRRPLATIAQTVGYQPDYLNRVLKQSCGLTLGELRNEIRMQQAKRLLSGSVPIAEAAVGIGFDDANYFSRWFRAQTGCTPRDWKKGKTDVSKRKLRLK